MKHGFVNQNSGKGSLLLQVSCNLFKLEMITDQCSAFDRIKKIEVLAAGIEIDFIFTGQLDYK